MACRVVILGSTGSIGRQAIDVASAHPEMLDVIALAAGSDEESLQAQAQTLGVMQTALGPEAAIELAALPEADIVLNAIVGAAGLRASVAALQAGKQLALANKESLVAGGEVCLAAAARGGGEILPVDSEHAAISQCLQGVDVSTVSRVVLTASGGPFRTRPDLSDVSPSEALAHPTWSMGPKITVDSATLMNKGLEVIEAHFLFELDYERIGIVVHPESAVHGIVEMIDGSSVIQAAPTDMRLPIQSALTTPRRSASGLDPIDLAGVGALHFEPVDHERFPSVNLAYEAGRAGRTHPAVLNAANEEAVKAFLADAVAFTDIPAVVEKVLASHDPIEADDLEAVLEVDSWAREQARVVMGTAGAPGARGGGSG